MAETQVIALALALFSGEDTIVTARTGLTVGAGYQYVAFTGLGKDIFQSGAHLAQVEGGFYWERDWYYASVTGFVTPWASARFSDLNAGPPTGLVNEELGMFLAGGMGRFAASFPDWHVGAGAGVGTAWFDETIEAQSSGLRERRQDVGVLYRAGVFVDRELTSTSLAPDRRLRLWIRASFDYYGTNIKDARGETIYFWSAGVAAVLDF